MKRHHIIPLASAVIFIALSFSSCSGVKKLEDLKITSARISSITPKGLRGAELGFQIGVDNPGTQISLSEISCDVKRFGKILGNVAVDPLTIQAKTEEVYDIDATVRLGENATIIDLGKLLDKGAADDLKVDLSARLKMKGGFSKTLVINDIPLKKLIETAKR